MDINMASAQDFVNDYLTYSGCDPDGWDVFGVAWVLVDWMDGAGVDSFDGVPSDVFTGFLEAYAR